MPKTDMLRRYLNPAFSYAFHQGPGQVRSVEDAMASGLNCISLAHLVLRDLFQQQLPSELHCAEMYRDQERFRPVAEVADARQGDLFWFGIGNPAIDPHAFEPVYADGVLLNWRAFPVKHVAIFTGEFGDEDNPLLLHASYQEGTTAVWPLDKFGEHSRYERLYGITRLNGAVATAGAIVS